MKCQEHENLLQKEAQGLLTPQEEAWMTEHQSECPLCKAQKTLSEDCRHLDEERDVPASFSKSWRQSIRQEDTRMNRKPIIRWMAIAATFIIVMGGTYLTGEISRAGKFTDLNAIKSDYDYGVTVMMAPAAAPQMKSLEQQTGAEADDMENSSEVKIIRNISMALSTKSFDRDLETIKQELVKIQGRIENMGLSTENGLRSCSLILRVPKDKLDGFVSLLKGVGTQVYLNESQQDVSSQYRDTDNRLKTQQIKMQRLQALLEKAAAVEDLLKVESAIADTQYELDRLTGEMKGLDSRINDSTLSLELREASTKDSAENKDESLIERIKLSVGLAFKAVVIWLGDLVVFLSVVFPYALVLGILIAVPVSLRKAKKRRENK